MNSKAYPLTRRQREFLRFIVAHLLEHQQPPTVRELGRAFGISSPNGVMCHLKALEAKGYIRREGCSARGIRLLGVEVALFYEAGEAGDRLKEALKS